MKLSPLYIKTIIKGLLKGENHRQVVVDLIDAKFLNFTMDFFKRIASAKIANENINMDWYKKEFIDDESSPAEAAIHAGLNKKTIYNMRQSATKDVVLDASHEHYDSLREIIEELVAKDSDIDFKLTIKYNSVSVELTISESLIVINTLAVKRAQIRGGVWSAQGKAVEAPLMETLCRLHGVEDKYFNKKSKDNNTAEEGFEREIDFYLTDGRKEYKCEVKLMGSGNSESADSVIARDSKVFVADKLSKNNKAQLNSLKVEWVELADEGRFDRFATMLTNLNIPYTPFSGNIDKRLDKILDKILP